MHAMRDAMKFWPRDVATETFLLIHHIEKHHNTRKGTCNRELKVGLHMLEVN